ncbi:HopJ type III effector protein [Paraglaciecola sp. L3A3]|uniref:HopJ type III effector protein n=1 Tax=Paraglaciecola sp. L3A3 TaxID=2686358 RepID=UPI00131B446D|nr:HopJ type III effector protein [Paraglaciecola sp. L3A3]
MTINDLIKLVRTQPETIEFSQVIQVIEQNYQYTPTTFTNGGLVSQAGSNEGSCKIFYFAQINRLNAAETLQLFGNYYRQDVLQHPQNSDHGNIRNFMLKGWAGITFDGVALASK